MYSPRPLQPTRYLPSPSSSPIKPVLISTNTDSGTDAVADTFKIPALPRYRLMTPSTSTIAASSSPRSSPVRLKVKVSTSTAAIREIFPDREKITILGRHRHHPTSSLPPGIPVLNSSRRVESIHLPRTAAHASRIHCVVECTISGGLRLVIVGQNGVRVRHDGGAVLRMKKGDVKEFEGDVDVDFYGCKVRIMAPPPKSPSPSPAPESKVETAKPELDADVDIDALSPAPELPPVALPVPDVDLPALIASTVVFSGSSKLSLPDLVKHMIESQPSLRDHGDEAQWAIWCAGELDGNPMFGKVQRHGKDSSGHPLLPHYFYVPDSDPDASRAKQLGGLVRPLRAAQRAGGKAIDWRPVGSGRRRY